jgi:hypothetical protein
MGQNCETGRRIEDYLRIVPDPDPPDQTNFRVFAASWRMSEKWTEVPAGLSPLLPLSCRFAYALMYAAKALGDGPLRFRTDMVQLVTGYPLQNIAHIFRLLAEVGILSHVKTDSNFLSFQVRASSRGRGWGVGPDPRFRPLFVRSGPPAKAWTRPVRRYGPGSDRQHCQQGAGLSA